MQLTYEIPTVNLKDFKDELDIGFVIAPQALKDKEYLVFYKDLAKKKYTILDNGAFELGRSISPKEIIDLALELGAKEIVVPDVQGNPKETIKVATEFFKYLECTNLTNKFIYQMVPQGETAEEVIYCMQSLSGFNWQILGVVARFGEEKDMEKNEQTRISILTRLGREMYPKQIHLLGLVDASKLSIYTELDIFKQIRSLDTSYPIAKALEQKTLSKSVSKPKARITYKEVMGQKQIEKAKSNIKWMREALTPVGNGIRKVLY